MTGSPGHPAHERLADIFFDRLFNAKAVEKSGVVRRSIESIHKQVGFARLMAEVHLLAQAYGWSEAETLSLSRWRRRVYLGMVRQ